MTLWHNLKLITHSLANFSQLVNRRELRLHKNRLGNRYAVNSYSVYSIFRESVHETKVPVNNPVVLVVGFRLKVIGNKPVMHWLFQRCCILTTPFWSGFNGFRVKLWMVDEANKNYLGIYQWDGLQASQTYASFLKSILKPLSVSGSVWSETYANRKLDEFLIT